MIIFKTLKWSNIFSYGKDNYLELDNSQVTQILGINGAGKSSIPLILEEVLFNKNSKGIKRSEVLNRFSKDKKYFISIEFEKITEIGMENYLIETSRGTTQSVKLSRIVDGNYEDLSSHTSTATYKNIENILGINFDIFCSLIYQSSSQSMGFLTSTDTVRKKFLIDLLGLTKYTEAFDIFKEVSKEVSSQVLEAETKVSTIQRWLDKNAKVDLTIGEFLDSLDEPRTLSEEAGALTAELKDIEETNKQISKNNQYKTLLDSIAPVSDIKVPESNEKLIRERSDLEATKRNAEIEIKRAKELKDKCPTCKQPVDVSFVPQLLREKEEIALIAETKLKQVQAVLDIIATDTVKFNKAQKNNTDFETYLSLHNSTLTTELKDKDSLQNKLVSLKTSIKLVEAEIKQVVEHNKKISAKNAQIQVIIEQSAEMQVELTEVSSELNKLSDRLVILEILKKAFSTNGLLAYKIECLVKNLENITNEYLGELSAGRFQLSFKIVGEKLNVVITDNGTDIDISALSSGEKARVSTSVLLSIRRLMQALSSTKVNLLILDETIDSLDVDGKEKLIEVLLGEVGLNTFLISHSFTHPLMDKITIIKENNISRLE